MQDHVIEERIISKDAGTVSHGVYPADVKQAFQVAAGHSILADGENPNFSPNGREIVYQSSSNIFTIHVTGGSPVRLTNEQHDSWPHWGRANDKIVFQRPGGYTANDIWVMDSNGSDPHVLIATGVDDYSPTWSPDCKKVVFVSFRWNNLDIYVYEMP